MKLLGIDFGMRRVGLAMTDPSGVMAFPLKPVERTGKDALYAELMRIIEAEKPEAVVVGLPTPPDGGDSLIVRQVKNFASGLKHRAGLPVHLVDETMTSAEAASRLGEAGLSGRRAKPALDSQAAVIILETFLAGR